MALPADYISGTITLTNGSPSFTGTGTGWQAADFREGDILLGVEDHAGQVYVIAAITGNATGTLTQEWAGTSGTYTYRMRYEWDSSRVSAQARAMVELLGNGNLESIAGLTGPGVVVLEGPHSAGIRPFSDFVNGVAYNVQVDTLADRAAYDGQSAGFAVLVSDVGDGRSAVYSKASNTSGDWTDPAYVTGPTGPSPAVEATVDTLPPGSTATVTPTPITGGVRLDFELPEASGFYNAGVYDIAEAYSQDDVVRHNGSSFIALQAVPAGTSPSNAFPPTDTAYWQVLAAKGADGAGTVSSVEPGLGIAVNSADPTAPIVSLDAALGDLKDVDLTTNPPEDGQTIVWDETEEKWVPGAGGGAPQDVEANISLLALEVADLKGSRFGMVGGIADPFDDESGIDAALSSNYVYDDANGRYSPSLLTSSESSSTPTTGGGFAGSTNIDRSWALNNNAVVFSLGAYSDAAQTISLKIARRVSAGLYDIIQSHSYSHPGGGWSDLTLPENYIVPATGDYHVALFCTSVVPTNTSVLRTINIGSGDATGTGLSGTESTGNITATRADYLISVEDMTLVSLATAATAEPDTGRFIVQIDTSEIVDINDDLIVELSRDDGGTWALGSLELITATGNIRTYQAQSVNLAGQPSGSDMRYRIKTFGKNIGVTGVVNQWG